MPADLAGPVELALAKAVEDVPGPHALSGGSRYELKWDGYRGVIVRRERDTRLWSRQRNDMTTQFPELITAAGALPLGMVVDGEVVIWNCARLDFDLLQKRLAGGTARIAAQVRAHPASFVAFDLLAHQVEGRRLAHWLSYQRGRYHAGALSPDRRRQMATLLHWDDLLNDRGRVRRSGTV